MKMCNGFKFGTGLCVFLLFLGLTIDSSIANEPVKTISKRKPNIVYIMLDDAGYGDFGAAGSKTVQTPNFDRMCKQGLFFDNHYSGSAVCAPTRCVLMTGLHSGHCKRRDNQVTANRAQSNNGLIFLGPNDVTVAKQLQKAGYTTGGIGKWGLGNSNSPGTPDKQGFDQFLGYLDQVHAHNHYTDWLWDSGKRMELNDNKNGGRGTYVPDIFETRTLKFIREQAGKDKPFFLYLPYTLPHGKYEIPANDPAVAIYKDKPWGAKIKNYAAMVTKADQTVGKILKLLKELDVDDDTIVFYTSDNGPNPDFLKNLNSGGPFRGIKRQLTEGGLRAAMVVRWPGKIKPNQTSSFAWSMIDVFPTLCDLADTKSPENLDGISVAPTLMGKTQEPIKSIYFEIHHPFQQAVRLGKWKGMRFGTEEKLKLFDVAKDPMERTDLGTKHPDIVQQIEKVMLKEHVESKFYPSAKKRVQKGKKRKKKVKQ